MKRVVAIGDMHCGHWAGLTPPDWQWRHTAGRDAKRDALVELQRKFWAWFSQEIKAIQPVHILAVNGDCVDGKGGRSGATELVAPSIFDQIDMAVQCIQSVRAQIVRMSYGTAYHVAVEGEDAESIIARNVGAEIADHLKFYVNDVCFSVKHHIGSSQIPHGRHTAIAKEALWDREWEQEREAHDYANLLLRSHVHYSRGSFGPGWLGMTLPALQGPGSKFGARRCSGTIDFGFCHFDIPEKGKENVWPVYHTLPVKVLLPSPERL